MSVTFAQTETPEDEARHGANLAATRVPFRRIYVVANPNSGQNSRTREPIEAALNVFGDEAKLYRWEPDHEVSETVDRAIADGAELIVAAGGDGTVMAVAQAMLGKGVPMAVLPLGTFNFYARGLRFSEDATEAAQQILKGETREIQVGSVDGRVFLNNASLGIYPKILKAREAIYARWGRHRMVAYWSVIRTFLKFQKPMKVDFQTEDLADTRATPLIFVARSAYQLDFFGLRGARAITDDKFAVLIAKGENRMQLFRLAWRLVTRQVREGRDYDVLRCREFTVGLRGKRRALLAFDGEKARMESPFAFRMHPDLLTIVLPEEKEQEAA
ncbi:diacylglycerol/lipid kinase family protein [Thioclava sp. GXIMD4215]|uniref:diacylglycerol/lipid kinase family protein n=1 Tax=Thioclava sp. GXIMD4215 TaxID=3131928 RepID=UPI00324C69C7